MRVLVNIISGFFAVIAIFLTLYAMTIPSVPAIIGGVAASSVGITVCALTSSHSKGSWYDDFTD